MRVGVCRWGVVGVVKGGMVLVLVLLVRPVTEGTPAAVESGVVVGGVVELEEGSGGGV